MTDSSKQTINLKKDKTEKKEEIDNIIYLKKLLIEKEEESNKNLELSKLCYAIW